MVAPSTHALTTTMRTLLRTFAALLLATLAMSSWAREVLIDVRDLVKSFFIGFLRNKRVDAVRGVSFEGAEMYLANFAGCKLDGADFRKADNLAGAGGRYLTIRPRGFYAGLSVDY